VEERVGDNWEGSLERFQVWTGDIIEIVGKENIASGQWRGGGGVIASIV